MDEFIDGVWIASEGAGLGAGVLTLTLVVGGVRVAHHFEGESWRVSEALRPILDEVVRGGPS